MEPTTGFLLAGAALLGLNAVYGILGTRRRRRVKLWESTARKGGLAKIQKSRESLLDPVELTARRDRMRVRFRSYDHGDDGGTHILVSADWPRQLIGFALHPETTATTSAEKSVEIVVGDEAFDDAFLVGGPAPAVRAWLDTETRAYLLELHQWGRVMIAHGELRVEVSERKRSLLPDVLRVQLGVARRLERRLAIAPALLSQVIHDPVPGVRLECLSTLTREFGPSQETGEAARAACGDADPEIRLRAALALGLEGQGVLFELAERLVDDACAAKALEALESKLEPERLLAILERARKTRRLAASRACLAQLGRKGGAAVLATLVEVMTSDGELGVDAARALGTTGLPAAEEPLIGALAREPAALRIAAAEALGAVGSAASVLPLKEAADEHAADKELGRAARQAVAEIQARLTGASPGQISLSDNNRGHLSVAGDTAGRLSTPDTED